jgi:hypothetical protein
MEGLIVVLVAAVVVAGAVLIFKHINANGTVDEVKADIDDLVKKVMNDDKKK